MVKCFEFERQCVLKDCEVRNYIYQIRQSMMHLIGLPALVCWT